MPSVAITKSILFSLVAIAGVDDLQILGLVVSQVIVAGNSGV